MPTTNEVQLFMSSSQLCVSLHPFLSLLCFNPPVCVIQVVKFRVIPSEYIYPSPLCEPAIMTAIASTFYCLSEPEIHHQRVPHTHWDPRGREI